MNYLYILLFHTLNLIIDKVYRNPQIISIGLADSCISKYASKHVLFTRLALLFQFTNQAEVQARDLSRWKNKTSSVSEL